MRSVLCPWLSRRLRPSGESGSADSALSMVANFSIAFWYVSAGSGIETKSGTRQSHMESPMGVQSRAISSRRRGFMDAIRLVAQRMDRGLSSGTSGVVD